MVIIKQQEIHYLNPHCLIYFNTPWTTWKKKKNSLSMTISMTNVIVGLAHLLAIFLMFAVAVAFGGLKGTTRRNN
jgi:hypothetical protein